MNIPTNRCLTALCVVALLLLAQHGGAVDSPWEVSWIPVSGISDGESSVSAKVASSVSNVMWMIIYPGFWIVMAIGSLVSLWGFVQHKKESIITGIALFLFAMVLRSLIQIAASV